MSFHVAAFMPSAVLTGIPSEQDVAAVTDTYLPLSGTRLYLEREFRVLAALSACGVEGGGLSPSVTRARIFTPSLAPLLAGLIRPLSATGNGAGSMAIPNDPLSLMTLLHSPLRVGPEELGIRAVVPVTQTSVDRAVGLVWLTDKPDFSIPASAGGGLGAFWVRFTTGVAGATAFNVWQSGALALDQSLPGGQYAVIGMDFNGAGGSSGQSNAIAARLIFNTQTMRPGVVAQNGFSYRNHSIFYNGALGVWGVFSNTSPPGIEVLCASATATTAEGYLQLIKIG